MRDEVKETISIDALEWKPAMTFHHGMPIKMSICIVQVKGPLAMD